MNKVIVFPATLYGDKSSVDGGRKITLDIAEENVGAILPLLAMRDKNFFVTIEPVATEQEFLEKVHETGDERRARYLRKIHAMMGDVAAAKKITKEQVRELIKGRLRKEGKLDESLNELSIRELGEVITRLEGVLYPIGEDEPEHD